MKSVIHIITTGGTIEGLDSHFEKGKSKISIQDFLNIANVSFEFTIEEAFKKDSRSITLDDRKELAEQIKASETDKILITHGTFTMEDTAKYNSILIL